MRNELFERYVLVYMCGGSFGSSVDKKNENLNYLGAKCLVYICGGSFGSVLSKQAKLASSFGDVCKWPCIL